MLLFWNYLTFFFRVFLGVFLNWLIYVILKKYLRFIVSYLFYSLLYLLYYCKLIIICVGVTIWLYPIHVNIFNYLRIVCSNLAEMIWNEKLKSEMCRILKHRNTMTEKGKKPFCTMYIVYAWSNYRYPNKEKSDICLDNKGP